MILKKSYKWKINISRRASGSDVCFRFCRFYPEDQSLADLASRNPTSSQYARVLSCVLCYLSVLKCACVCFSGGRGRGWILWAKEETERKKNAKMDEGSLGALRVLIIHCSVVGSELTISPWLYSCLMICAVPLSLSLQLLWPNKEKREGKEGVLQQWLCHIYH